jgi:molybdenum cofactor biosynthesis enzyme MoaA/predicted dehydrogenase
MASASQRASRRSATLHVGGTCSLQCGLCDCRSGASDAGEVGRVLQDGCARLTLRGTTERNPRALDLVRLARGAGVGQIVVRTNAIACRTPEAAAALARSGVDGVLVPLFSHAPAVHDRIAGRSPSLRHTLDGMAQLARAGLGVEVEIPLLSPKLQSLTALIGLAREVVPSLRAVRFYLPSQPVAEVLAPPAWDVAGPLLAKAIRLCRDGNIEATLSTAEGIPLCALRDFSELLDAYSFNPTARSSTWGGSRLGTVCESCAVRGQCPGIVRSYAEAHGEAGLAAWERRPAGLRPRRTTALRRWTEEQRQAARRRRILVLRPTVNCNQDCTFCSANETTENVWSDKATMLRQIARAARTGVRRVSFSGGEPTLSKDLVSYVRTASRCGIEDIELVTNGVLLDSPPKVAALRQAGLTNAFVSLHAHDERLSRVMTQKVDDFPRTIRAIHLLLDAGIRTVLNHVVNARNYPHLQSFVEMVHREFGGQTRISFAFVTPQYKALEHLDQVPRLSDVAPYLRRAIRRALVLGQPIVVGSRQGVPPCFLGEFRAWSDVFQVATSAASEDAPQKQRGEACDACRYSRQCPGLWKPYIARYGTSELRPVPGPAYSDAEAEALWRQPYPQGVPMSLAEVPEPLRDHAAEAESLDVPAESASSALPIFRPERSRPVRVLLIGTGRQARRIARAAANVAGLSIDAVASPHALEADLRDFGSCPAYDDPAAAIADIRPEGIIIAASTAAHASLARLALDHRIPALVEKPLAASLAEAEALVHAEGEAGTTLVVAHNAVAASGLEEIFALADENVGSVSYVVRRRPESPDAPRAWSRSALSETLYHVLSVALRAMGTDLPEVIRAQVAGDSRPERIRLDLRNGDLEADVVLDFTGGRDEDRLTRRLPGVQSELVWYRSGGATSLTHAGVSEAIPHDGSDIERMLVQFRDLLLNQADPATTTAEALQVMQATALALDAIAAAGAPFDRAQAPRHFASRELREAS